MVNVRPQAVIDNRNTGAACDVNAFATLGNFQAIRIYR